MGSCNVTQGNQQQGPDSAATQIQTMVNSEQVVAWQQSERDVTRILSVDQHNTPTPFAHAKSRRGRKLPAGVKAIARPTRTTPDRQAKTSKDQQSSRRPTTTQSIPDTIDLDIEGDASPTGSGDMVPQPFCTV